MPPPYASCEELPLLLLAARGPACVITQGAKGGRPGASGGGGGAGGGTSLAPMLTSRTSRTGTPNAAVAVSGKTYRVSSVCATSLVVATLVV